jgi:4-hydroxy-4-methyl-2-oxoglutarate aldolase
MALELGIRDLKLIERLARLNPAVVADCLDKIGHRHQVMEPHVGPLYPSATIAGYAATVRCIEVDVLPETVGDYYKGELRAVDALQPGDVMVVSTCRASLWGELLATAARFRGARGIVADAYTRDSRKLIDMEFPTFVAGISAYDSLGRVDVDGIGVPIECGGVTVAPSDLVLADCDGVVVVPADVAEEILEAAEAKSSDEDIIRDKLAEGMSTSEAFRKYGVL